MSSDLDRAMREYGKTISSINLLSLKLNMPIYKLNLPFYKLNLTYVPVIDPNIFKNYRASLLPAVKILEQNRQAIRLAMLPYVQNTLRLSNSLKQFTELSESLGRSVEAKLNLSTLSLNAYGNLSAEMQRITSSFVSLLKDARLNIDNIDFTGLPNLNKNIIQFEEENKITEAGTDLNKKRLVDMTGEDFLSLIQKSITPKKVFSVGAFIYSCYSDYVHDAARLLIEVMLVFCVSICTGHLDSGVKEAIKERINSSKTVKDMRYIITKYVKVKPYRQIGFLRIESFLREGRSRSSHVVCETKITPKTMLNILERKGNWIKVEIDSEEYTGEIGWFEESKVLRYKMVK